MRSCVCTCKCEDYRGRSGVSLWFHPSGRHKDLQEHLGCRLLITVDGSPGNHEIQSRVRHYDACTTADLIVIPVNPVIHARQCEALSVVTFAQTRMILPIHDFV
jgi:hypothetical protein